MCEGTHAITTGLHASAMHQHRACHSPIHAPAAQDGKHYYFTTKEKFQAGIEKGAFLEHAEVHSNFYGTSAAAVRKVANAGKCCILDIDVQGARQVRCPQVLSNLG